MDIYEILKSLDIDYQEVEHEAVYTVEQAQKADIKLEGIGCKNLFLTNKKDRYVLVILEESKKADMKEVKDIANLSNLSFASETTLENVLKLKMGSVTPFGIINDTENKVTIVIDKELKDKKLLFHPNINTKTILINYDDLIKFIEFEKHKYLFI